MHPSDEPLLNSIEEPMEDGCMQGSCELVDSWQPPSDKLCSSLREDSCTATYGVATMLGPGALFRSGRLPPRVCVCECASMKSLVDTMRGPQSTSTAIQHRVMLGHRSENKLGAAVSLLAYVGLSRDSLSGL